MSICAVFPVHGAPLDQLLMGWPEQAETPSLDGLSARSSSANWYQKDNQKLDQYSQQYSAKFQQTYGSKTFGLAGKHIKTELKFKDNKNFISIGEDYDAWSVNAQTGPWNVWAGNRELSAAFDHDQWQIKLSRTKVSQEININTQDELESPQANQFIFKHDWQDQQWQLQASWYPFSISYQQLQHATDDYQWSSSLRLKNWQHQINYRRIHFNYGQASLADEHYSYGDYEWRNFGQSWFWQTRLQQETSWWSLGAVVQDISFKTRGIASLINVIGPSANLAGATWSWGIQGNFKNTGLKLDHGWQHQGWQHHWQLSLNKLRPFINSKIYKNIILIGLPRLEEEEELDIEYMVLAQLGWKSQFRWQMFSVTTAITQLLPLYTRKRDASGETSAPESPGQPSSSGKSRHSGYRVVIGLNWYY